jgi:mRNA interferase HigB
MRIIARRKLVEFWTSHPRSEQQLKAWYAEAESASWASPADVKAKYGNASILKDGRVVFNICGNEYRLVVWVNYDFFTI